MSYAIVYSSKTGNTKQLAQALRDSLPAKDCLYFGQSDPAALGADRVYVGFWTNIGSCDDSIKQFLSQIGEQEVFLFGTAGFGGSAEYFEKILTTVKQSLPPTAKLVGEYMCQGRMPAAVQERYQKMEDSPKKQLMIQNFDAALDHPNSEDTAALIQAVQNTL